eukprot:5477029-Pyramimonas_sp.AAC.1
MATLLFVRSPAIGVRLSSFHPEIVGSVGNHRWALVGTRRHPGCRTRLLPLSFRGSPARQQSFKCGTANVRGSLV